MLSLQPTPSPPPLPPPPAAAAVPPLSPPPARRKLTPLSLKQIVISKPPILQQQRSPSSQTANLNTKTSIKQASILHQRQGRTNLVVWCGAIFCLIFSLLLIFLGMATLIIYLVVKPKYPVFDVPNARLNVVYFDTAEYLNGDLIFLANISNPNRKIGVKFEYSEIELCFSDRPIATQVVQPFNQQPGEAKLVSVHMISSLVYLPQNLGMDLEKQVASNRVKYNIRGSFKVKASFGLIHISYWLHSRCQIEITGPPTGALVSHSCQTKR